MRKSNAFHGLMQQKISKLNFPLLLIVLITTLYGLFILYSAGGSSLHPWVSKQLIHILLCLPPIIFLTFVDLRIIYKFSYLIYFVILALLVFVELKGYTAMGATRWINIGSFRFQPSEPAKLALVFMLAKYFQNISEEQTNNLFYLILPIFGTLIPAFLIIKQPDLGTGIILLSVAITVFFAAGVSIWKFVILGISVLGSMPIIWQFLKAYQKKRIMVFLNPEYDPKGAGYNIIQSKIAIGSGKIFGKGLGSGTQSHLRFLPEHQTDFIFASLCEEFGFVGGTLLLILYGLIIYISIAVAINTKNIYGKLLVIGIVSIFFSHALINISMVMGLMPAVGVPLPLISYGGTMIVSMLSGFAIIMNVHINKNILFR